MRTKIDETDIAEQYFACARILKSESQNKQDYFFFPEQMS